jgi:hypothetical protein
LITLYCSASRSASGRVNARSQLAPPTTTTGRPAPSRSKAIEVPSAEITLSISLVIVFSWVPVPPRLSYGT